MFLLAKDDGSKDIPLKFETLNAALEYAYELIFTRQQRQFFLFVQEWRLMYTHEGNIVLHWGEWRIIEE